MSEFHGLLLHTMACPHLDPFGALDLAETLALDGIELIVQSGYRAAIDPDASPGDMRSLARAARERRIPIAALVSYEKGMTHADSGIRADAVKKLDHALSLAAELGAEIIRVFAGQDVASMAGRDAAVERMCDALRPLGDRAHSLGVALCIENHMDTLATSAAATVEIVNAIGHTAFGIVYDQPNLDFIKAEGFPQGFDLQKGKLKHVHVKDFFWTETGERWATVVGEGIVPWDRIIGALTADRYTGYLSLEYEARWFPHQLPPPEIGLARSRDCVRRLQRECRSRKHA